MASELRKDPLEVPSAEDQQGVDAFCPEDLVERIRG
jgi:hypothetical protein